MENLFKKGIIGNRVIQNRWVAQPMEGNSSGPGGSVSELTIDKYKKLAAGGWGVIIVEAVSVTSGSLARKNALVMNYRNLDGFKKLVDHIKAINPDVTLLFQITHSGSISNPVFSEQVSISPLSEGRLLSSDEIEQIKDDFITCSLLAEEVGADGIDYKCCHGYLGAEMLRPANVRTDKWGGSWENRTRFLREGIEEIIARRKTSNFILGSRISVYEGLKGCCGTSAPNELIEDLTESLQLVRLMDSLHMDYVNVSAGIPAKTPNLTRPVQKAELMYLNHLRYTKEIKNVLKDSSMKVIGSAYSILRERAFSVADEMLEKRYTDFIGWGRQTLADPLTPRKLQNGEKVNFCMACSGCSKMMLKQINVGCIIFNEYYKKYWKENL